MAKDVSSGSDILDIRDAIERFEELEEEHDRLSGEVDEADAEGDPAKLEEARAALDLWAEDEGEEFKKIGALLEELRGSGGDHQWQGDWFPISLIRDSYFVEAMQEMVQDIGDLPKDIPAYLAIDWDATAENLRADYSSVEYDGVTYWYR